MPQREDNPRWTIVVLAAGQGRRMGSPKALMPVGGRPWWEIQEERLAATNWPQIWVVSPRVAKAMARSTSLLVIGYEQAPMFDSVRAGIEASTASQGVFILPVDVPAPGREVFEQLAAAAGTAAAVPVHKGQRGHPVALSRAWIDRIFTPACCCGGEQRLDELLGPDLREVPVDDPAVLVNLNTPEDLEQWNRRMAPQPAHPAEAAAMLSHVAPDGRARMVDVGDKSATDRCAIAEGFVRISPALQQRIRENTVTKGSVLEVARLAGILAAKRTDELIPLCHSLPLDAIDIAAELHPGRVRISATVRTHGRTGVEMEALTAVSIACLTVIDMGKAVDKSMVIESLRLLEKQGGSSGTYVAPQEQPHTSRNAARHQIQPPIRAAVLTISDRCSRGQAQDTSGPAVAELLRSRLGAAITATACIPDEQDQIAAAFLQWSRPDACIDLVLSTGGTGLSPRDVTPEAARQVLQREHSGLLDLARLRCLSRAPQAFLSRGIAGTIGRTLIITLPGSERGATETLEAMLDLLPHAVQTLRGEVPTHPSEPAAAAGSHAQG